MWRNLEEEAFYIGLNYDYFWSLTPKTYQKHVKAFDRKRKEELQNIDYLNNILGQYISYAFNDPKKYPKPYLREEKRVNLGTMTGEEMEEQVKRNTLMMGGVINDS